MLTKETKLLKDKLISKSQKRTHSQQQSSYTLSIGYICFQKVQPIIKSIIEDRFKNISCIKMNNCDLRSVINFPKLPQLTDLDLSKNSLQGNFQPLLKNTRIMYFDISKNMIRKLQALTTLKQIAPLQIYVHYNPLLPFGDHQQDSQKFFQIQTKLKFLGISLLKETKSKKEKTIQVKKQSQEKSRNQPFLVDKNSFNQQRSSLFRALRSSIPRYSKRLRDSDLRFQQKQTMLLQYIRETNQNKLQLKKPLILSSFNNQFTYPFSPRRPSQLSNNRQILQRSNQYLQSGQLDEDGEQVPNENEEQIPDEGEEEFSNLDEQQIPNEDEEQLSPHAQRYQVRRLSERANDDDSMEVSDSL